MVSSSKRRLSQSVILVNEVCKTTRYPLVACELLMDWDRPTSAPRSDVDGVAYRSCPHGRHCSTSEPKHCVIFQFERPRHSPSAGYDEVFLFPLQICPTLFTSFGLEN